jgi:hypothetical protein
MNPAPDQSFDDQKILEKIQLKKLIKNCKFSYPWDSLKDVQATGEAFSPQKRTSSTSKNKIY